LRLIGAISQLSGVRYWSTTHQSWQTLILDAHALSGPQGGHRRGDFSPDELKEGGTFYFEQMDNLSGKAVYRMHIAEASANRIVFDVENVTTMRYFMLTLFHPAELQTIYFLERESPDVWRYYAMARTGKNASSLTSGKEVCCASSRPGMAAANPARAAATDRADAYRSSGSLAISRATSSAISPGTSGRTRRRFGGGPDNLDHSLKTSASHQDGNKNKPNKFS
jgi:hypothetical protein